MCYLRSFNRLSTEIAFRRSVKTAGGVDFARQLAERDASLNSTATRKFRSTAAPKGTKLKSGYQDRTQLRMSTDDDEKATRVKALEDMVKLGQMQMATFEALRDQIIGGNVKDTHLVKGLDWKLLERVRKGEDVLAGTTELFQPNIADGEPKDRPTATADVDVEAEFEMIEEQEVQPVRKEEKSKKGEMAPPAIVAGKKRNRDDILKELKASRLAAAGQQKLKQEPNLGPRFTKVGDKKEKTRIERDERGREVLITVDEHGRVKRKVKVAKVEDKSEHGLLMPDKDAIPLGMEVAPTSQPALDEGNGDIFEGVGDEYDPLGGSQEDDSDGSREEGEQSGEVEPRSPSLNENDETPQDTILSDEVAPSLNPPHIPNQTLKSSRNYFGETSNTEKESSTSTTNNLADPAILAALKRASAIKPISSRVEMPSEEETAKIARRKKMLENHDRDQDDLDMGFGGSRLEDEEDGADSKVKLSVWGKEGEDEDGKGGGKGKRKRAPKKRKGDANNAADVLKVMAMRKAAAE